MINFIKNQLGNIKSIAVLVLLGLFIFSWVGKRIEKNKAIESATENAILDTENYLLKKSKAEALSLVEYYKGRIELAKESLKLSHSIRYDIGLKLNEVTSERDALKDTLQNIASNELFKLFNDLYKFPGGRKYSINIKQVGEAVYVKLDYELVKEENQELYKDISQCDIELILKDSIIEASLLSMVALEDACNDSDEIILNRDKRIQSDASEIKRLERKVFWTKVKGVGVAVLGVVTGIAIVLN